MKKFRSYFILILAAVIMSSCSGLNKMKKNAGLIKYDVTPKVLETHAGTVNVTIKGTFPEKYFDKKTTLTATPVLTYAGGETAFENVQVVQGESVSANNKVISYSGGEFTYTSSIPFKDAMRMSELILKVKATRGTKSLDFEPVKLADGVIATSTLVEKAGMPILMRDKYVRVIPETQVADINYVINQADIRSSELKQEDIALLRQYIQDVTAASNKELKGVTVSSYASPDGSMKINEPLAGKRGSSADKFIKKEFSKVEAAKATDFFDEITTPEDWEGFKAEVEKSNIQDKELILRVLSMYSDPDVREREIKNMSAAYDELKTQILPKLRRSKIAVNTDVIGRTDEQISAQMKSDPSVLSIEEQLRAGFLAQDMNEALKYYQTAANKDPKDIRPANNIGYAYMVLGKTDEAIAAFQKAQAIENNDIVKNNLGIATLAKGDVAKAEEYFNSMTAQTPESRWGLGTIAIIKGEYDKAVNSFGTEPSFNLGLALVLKGDVNRAKTTLDNVKDAGKTGKPAYLKAVVGARQDDRNYMLNNLREATAANASWKGLAKTDLEFAKFFNDDTFKSAVQ
ncbi:MAG TPA: tetratricopeptide repeat protein [Bacteroidales bacterium]|nr:tetratricopeptide repeat protein [Bacteroidales bacterium]